VVRGGIRDLVSTPPNLLCVGQGGIAEDAAALRQCRVVVLEQRKAVPAAIGRDPKTILRSAVMIPVLSEDRAEIDRIQQIFMNRMNRDKAAAQDTMRAGSVAQTQDKLGKLREAGVGLLFIPTMFLGKDQLKPLDAFIEKVAPALRESR